MGLANYNPMGRGIATRWVENEVNSIVDDLCEEFVRDIEAYLGKYAEFQRRYGQ